MLNFLKVVLLAPQFLRILINFKTSYATYNRLFKRT